MARGNLSIPAVRDKQAVALTSVVAAVVLTGLKLAVGLVTGSLGVLAEAAHSGLDLVAALTTWLAVRIADREADETHPYGHERFENLAAFFEVGLLLVTCAWIVYEAVQRIAVGGGHVNPSIAAFAVMAISILVDWWRSRALRRAAREHDSPALEADALHFSTDMWASAIVIVGLALVWVAERMPEAPWLVHGDAAAALGVAGVAVWVSLRLLWGTVQALSDTAPPGVAEAIRHAAMGVDGVLSVGRIRLRRAGGKLFVDLVVAIARTTGFTSAHRIADEVEARVGDAVPKADVVVHVEPVVGPSESATDRVHYVARERGVRVHDVRVRQVGPGLEVDLHVEVDPALRLTEAHAVASGLEQALLDADDRLSAVNTHLEAPDKRIARGEDVTDASADLVRKVGQIADRLIGPDATHHVRVYRRRDVNDLILHAAFRPDLGVEQVHELSARIERALRAEIQAVGSVLIHAEPRGGPGL